MSGGGNWNSAGQSNLPANPNLTSNIGSSNTNTLTYGSLKNRFLSGSTSKTNNAAGGTATGAMGAGDLISLT